MFVCFFLSLFVCQSLAHLVSFEKLLRCADKRIFNIMKVYTERNKMQVELIRFRKKNINFIHVYFYEARNSMQYRSPNATLDSCCHTVSIITSRWSHLFHIVHHGIQWNGAPASFFLPSCSPNYATVGLVPAMNGHPRDQAKMSVHDSWPLIGGTGGQVRDATYNTQRLSPPAIFILNTCIVIIMYAIVIKPKIDAT